MKKFLLLPVLFLFLASIFLRPVFAETAEELQKRINELQSKITELQGQGKTLSSQIAVMDNQINLTELKIASTEQQITDLTLDIDTTTKKIGKLENSLDNLTKILINRIKATYITGTASSFQILLGSSDVSDFVERANYLRIAQAHDKRLIYDTVQAKNDYSNQKEIFQDKKKDVEALKAELEAYNSQLEQEKAAKNSLLVQTRGSEATYQTLLAQARAQLAGFSRFVSSQGGASILPAQASPDGWFYNQRDERWGNNQIGSSGEPVWKYGCLLTSVAMVLKQRGEDVSPAGIAASSGYYFSDTAYMLIPWAGRFTSVWGSNTGAIDSILSSGKPVIVGLSAGAYGTHFVVLKSGSGGNYVMNDPWNGADLQFTGHYSTGQIFQYGYLN